MRTPMAAQAIPFSAKIRSGIAIYLSYRSGRMRNAGAAIRYHRQLREQFELHVGKPIESARILEVGCGQLATQVALFASLGAKVTGIDVEVPTYKMTPSIFARVVRENGMQRAVKSTVRHVLFDRRTIRAVEQESGLRLHRQPIDARVMDACHMDIESDSVDFIFSHSVFEHIDDVPAAVQEINRVLSPGGLAFIATHLFPSVSGGHNLAWLRPDTEPSSTVPAWDHLRERRFPVDTYMNELKLNDYRSIFGEGLDVFEEGVSTEGETLLTPELEMELVAKGFTREDLLSRVYTIHARKKT